MGRRAGRASAVGSKRALFAFAAFAWLIVLAGSAPADGWRDAFLSKSQNAIGNVVPNLVLASADGGKITLAQFRGRPLLVSLVYTGCADVCPTVIDSLAVADRVAEETFGKGRFNILTVGFDARRDTPERMRAFARTHRAGGDNWLFASADAATLDRLATAAGFDFAASSGGFDHPAQVTVVDGEGRVYSQIYGGAFQPPAVIEPLKALIFGGSRPLLSIRGLGDRIKLFCSVYDSRTGRYYFDYSIILSVLIGALFLAGTFHFLLRELRKSMRAGGV